MTVDEVISNLTTLKKDGIVQGDTPVIWQSLSHTWDIELTITTRSGKTVILVNS